MQSGPNQPQRAASGTSPISSRQPSIRALSAARSSRYPACAARLSGVSPAGTRSAPTSRIRIAPPRPSRPSPPATAMVAWSIRSGSTSISPAAHTCTGGQRAASQKRMVQSWSGCTCLSTRGWPSITNRSNDDPDFESVVRKASRCVAPTVSSCTDDATGRGVRAGGSAFMAGLGHLGHPSTAPAVTGAGFGLAGVEAVGVMPAA